MTGRPKPTRVKELAGNPGKRAPNKHEPAPETTGIPKPPAHLGRFGKSLWKTYAGKMVGLGLLTDIDVPAWETLCLAYDRMREAGADIKRLGLVCVKDDIARMRPEVRIEAEARKEFRHYCTEFGLTPASWSRVAAGLAEGKQAALPMDMPEERDPSKQIPEGPWTDAEYFGTPATRH